MRISIPQVLFFSVIAVTLLGARGADPTRVDVGDERAKLTVLTDGRAHFFAYAPVMTPGAVTAGFSLTPERDNDQDFFYGDGKTFYVVPRYTWASDATDGTWHVTFLDQRFRGNAEVGYEGGTYTVTCDDKVTQLEPVSESRARKMMAKAEFRRSPFSWKPHALARDESGTYFYVDRGRYADNEKAFRVFIGMKGNMELQKLKNVVADSEGEIFSTPRGDLRLVLNRGEYWWVTPEKREQLTIVPPERNRDLIFNDLGVYLGQEMGTPCDSF